MKILSGERRLDLNKRTYVNLTCKASAHNRNQFLILPTFRHSYSIRCSISHRHSHDSHMLDDHTSVHSLPFRLSPFWGNTINNVNARTRPGAGQATANWLSSVLCVQQSSVACHQQLTSTVCPTVMDEPPHQHLFPNVMLWEWD